MNEDEFMTSCFRILTLSLMLAVVAGLSAPATAQSPAGTYDLAVNQTASATCYSGEPVAASGNLHFAYTFTTDPATGNFYRVRITSNFSGIGQTTQTTYTGSGSFGYDFPSPDSVTQVTIQLGTRLNSDGSAPSLMLNQTVNITVDTSGNISASVASSSTQCVGN